MPLVGIPDYLPYRPWMGVDHRQRTSDSGLVAMRLREEVMSSSSSASSSSSTSSNCSPEFPAPTEFIQSAIAAASASSNSAAVCAPNAPTSSSSTAVAPALPTSTPSTFVLNSYHHQNQQQQQQPTGPMLQMAGDCVAVGSKVFLQKQHQTTNQLQSMPTTFTAPAFGGMGMGKASMDAFGVHRPQNGNIPEPANLQSFPYLLANSSMEMEQRATLGGLIGQMNGGDSSWYRWTPMQKTTFPVHQQSNGPAVLNMGKNDTRDYDPWHFQLLYGQNGSNQVCNGVGGERNGENINPINGFSSSPNFKKPHPVVPNAGTAHGFYGNQNGNGGTRSGSFSASSSSSSCYSGTLLASNHFKNGFSSNPVDSSLDVANESSGRTTRSLSLTPPNGANFTSSISTSAFEAAIVEHQQQPQPHPHPQPQQHQRGIALPDSGAAAAAWTTTTTGNLMNGNGHGQDDVFSNMNTFNARIVNSNGGLENGRKSGRHHENGFSPEQCRRSGSGSGSMSGGEHAESPVQQRNTFYEPGSGMRNVPVWLKNLRLHKYEWLFCQLTYDEMLHLTVEQLAMQKICEGARKKIYLSVQKLRERVPLLKQLEKELVEPAGMKACALTLKCMIDTPIRPYAGPGGRQNLVDIDQTLIDGIDVDANAVDDANLPAHFTRVLYKTCCKVLNSASPGMDEECVVACSFSLDRAQNNDAFTPAQKRRLGSIKQQIRRLHATMPRKLTPRSNSWSKDRRQSLGTAVVNTRPSNGTKHSLHRQSSLGNNGGVSLASCLAPSADISVLPGVVAPNKPVIAYQQQIHSTNGLSHSVKSDCSAAPSYAAAVLGSQKTLKSGDQDDTVQKQLRHLLSVQESGSLNGGDSARLTGFRLHQEELTALAYQIACIGSHLEKNLSVDNAKLGNLQQKNPESLLDATKNQKEQLQAMQQRLNMDTHVPTNFTKDPCVQLRPKMEMRVVSLGLDGSGKTTIISKLKENTILSTVPTIGSNIETIEYKNVKFTMLDVGGQQGYRSLWKHYYRNSQALIFVIDSCDRTRLAEVQSELVKLLNENELRDASLLIYANKQDVDTCMSVDELVTALTLSKLCFGRSWYLQPCDALNGYGVWEGIDWLTRQLMSTVDSSP